MSDLTRDPYRDEGRPIETPEYVPVHRDRLAHLQRCEAVLDELDGQATWFSHLDGPWEVTLYTGGRSGLYPCTAEGAGITLREAVENAKGWGRVPVVRPTRDTGVVSRTAFLTFLAVLGWFFLGWFFVGLVL